MLRWEHLDWSVIFPSSYLVLFASCIFIINMHTLKRCTRWKQLFLSQMPSWSSETELASSKHWGVSQYECDNLVRWPCGEVAVEWYEAEKFVLSCYMCLEWVKYLVWICWDTYSWDSLKSYLGRKCALESWLSCVHIPVKFEGRQCDPAKNEVIFRSWLRLVVHVKVKNC
jgi:hypothetical protein